MRIRGLARLRRIARQFQNRFRSRVLVLMYHRIVDEDEDPHLLSVSPRHFAEHLEILSQVSQPMSLQDLACYLKAGSVPHRAVVVTFDDGYVDNLASAKGILERYEVSATVFVTAGFVGSMRSFWWDDLWHVLFEPWTLPESVELRIGPERLQWSFAGAMYSSDEDRVRHRHWRIYEPELGSRESAYCQLHRLLTPLPHTIQANILDQLADWAGIRLCGSSVKRVMRREELLQLADGGLIEVGAHTMNHSRLSALSNAELEQEVFESKKQLEQIIQRPVTSFAYPYGGSADYNLQAVACAKRAGFHCACTTIAAPVEEGTDRFQLPRFHVPDCDGRTFSRCIEDWFLD